jgi:hypothetical protein
MATVIPIEELRRTPTAALFEGATRPRSRSSSPSSSAGKAELTVTGGHFVVAPAQTPHRFIGTGDDTLRVIGIHPSGAVQQTDL